MTWSSVHFSQAAVLTRLPSLGIVLSVGPGLQDRVIHVFCGSSFPPLSLSFKDNFVGDWKAGNMVWLIFFNQELVPLPFPLSPCIQAVEGIFEVRQLPYCIFLLDFVTADERRSLIVGGQFTSPVYGRACGFIIHSVALNIPARATSRGVDFLLLSVL